MCSTAGGMLRKTLACMPSLMCTRGQRCSKAYMWMQHHAMTVFYRSCALSCSLLGTYPCLLAGCHIQCLCLKALS